MLYVWQATWKQNVTREQQDAALERRATWSYPDGLSVRGEYWVQGTPTVIVVFETTEVGAIFELGLMWGDVFDITVNPALTPEEGLRLGPDILSRRPNYADNVRRTVTSAIQEALDKIGSYVSEHPFGS
jgi:hypothetical protein